MKSEAIAQAQKMTADNVYRIPDASDRKNVSDISSRLRIVLDSRRYSDKRKVEMAKELVGQL